MPPRQIAVLGGGITGLTSAFHLSRRFPQAQITILEKAKKEGGWIRSKRVLVHDEEGHEADICLEAGPRTLRPNAQGVLELIYLLKLDSSLILTPKTADAAKKRFLHIPGTKGLTEFPSSVSTAIRSAPLTSMLVQAVAKDSWEKQNRPADITDESFDSLFSRRFGAETARLMGSALIHGIYAADSRKLSVRAAFPAVWDNEELGDGSVLKGLIRARRKEGEKEEENYNLGDVRVMVKGISVFSFKDGLSTLTRSLRDHLAKLANVSFWTSSDVVALHPNEARNEFDIRTKTGTTLSASHVVSTIPLPTLQTILPNTADSLPHLTANPSSSVKVVNIVFPPTSTPIHPAGFGYLVPRPEQGYENNSEANPGILGTVFDSCSLATQDRLPNTDILFHSSESVSNFTKLTVMLGGPYNVSPAQTEMSAVLAQLQNHLQPQNPLPEPVYYEVHDHKDCIPIPTVGHLDRMQELKEALESESGPWKGRLEVIGAGVGGVSVGDCVEAGRKVGRSW